MSFLKSAIVSLKTIFIVDAGVTEIALLLFTIAPVSSRKLHVIEVGTSAAPSSSRKDEVTI